jgi:hypothetical protein
MVDLFRFSLLVETSRICIVLLPPSYPFARMHPPIMLNPIEILAEPVKHREIKTDSIYMSL